MPSAVIRLGIEGEKEVKDALRGVQRDAESLERFFAAKLSKELGASGTQAADGIKPLGGQLGNVVAQLNDIGVSLASGQSPFTVMLQQGSQLSGILGDRGVKGALSALGQGLTSMINPLNLLFLGFGALAAGASYAIDLISKSGRSLDDVLKDANESLKKTTELLSEYGIKLEKAVFSSPGLTTFSQQQSVTELREKLEQEIDKLVNSTKFKELRVGLFTAYPVEGLQGRFAPFAELIQQLDQGKITLAQFNEGVANIGRVGGPEIAKAAGELLNLGTEATKAAGALLSAEAAMRALTAAGLADIPALSSRLHVMTIQTEQLRRGITLGITAADPTANQRIEGAFSHFAGLPTPRTTVGGGTTPRASRGSSGSSLAADEATAALVAYREQLEILRSATTDTAGILGGLFRDVAKDIDSAGEALANFGSKLADLLLQLATKPIENWIASSLMSLLSPGSPGGGAGISSLSGGLFGLTPGGWYHEGGAVPGGRPGLFPASLFRFAPRLHGGLASDEFPAILQRGERVIPKSRAGMATETKIVVINPSRDFDVKINTKVGRATHTAMSRSQRERDRRG